MNGGSYYPESEQIDYEWIRHINSDDLIGFVPSATIRSEETYLQFFIDKMLSYKLSNIVPIDLYQNWDIARKVKVIYIAGGNTYKLLDIMNKSGFKDYIKDNHMNKVIIGNSAGAVVLGKDIRTSNSENTIGLDDTEGIGLVDFSICPHYTIDMDSRLESLSRELKHEVVGIPETSGIIIDNAKEKSINFIRRFD